MRGVLLMTALILISPVMPALATGLEEHNQSVRFSLVHAEVDDVGSTSDVGVAWLYNAHDGHIQVGAEIAYVNDDPDIGPGVNGYFFGPELIFNFTPDGAASGFVILDVVAIGGDFGDAFDFGASLGIGVRAFINDTASLDFIVSRSRLYGADSFPDVDTTALTGGFPIFFGD